MHKLVVCFGQLCVILKLFQFYFFFFFLFRRSFATNLDRVDFKRITINNQHSKSEQRKKGRKKSEYRKSVEIRTLQWECCRWRWHYFIVLIKIGHNTRQQHLEWVFFFGIWLSPPKLKLFLFCWRWLWLWFPHTHAHALCYYFWIASAERRAVNYFGLISLSIYRPKITHAAPWINCLRVRTSK